LAGDPKDYLNFGHGSEEDYRRRQAMRARRRKKRRQQKLILLAAFALAAILLIVCIVLVFNAVLRGGEDDSSSSPVSSSSSSVPVSSGPWHPTAADPTAWNLKLVNANHPLPEGFAMPDSELGGIVQGGVVTYYFDADIIEPLRQLIEACNAVEGHTLQINSGYRKWATQESRFDHQTELYQGQGFDQAAAQAAAWLVQPPAGYSEHQIGLAVDFVTGTVQAANINFAGTPEFQWLVNNAAQYGFILRYPEGKEAITGQSYQPYLWRYVGVEDAHAIMGSGICLEEYLMEYTPEESATGTSQAAPASTQATVAAAA